MVEGIQFKKLSLKRQVDSVFGDEDLMRLGDGEIQGMVEEYFGEDWRKALDYVVKRRSELLKNFDERKYQREYYKVRKAREYRFPIRLNYERDADLIEFLGNVEDKCSLIRQVLREYVDKNKKGR